MSIKQSPECDPPKSELWTILACHGDSEGLVGMVGVGPEGKLRVVASEASAQKFCSREAAEEHAREQRYAERLYRWNLYPVNLTDPMGAKR